MASIGTYQVEFAMWDRKLSCPRLLDEGSAGSDATLGSIITPAPSSQFQNCYSDASLQGVFESAQHVIGTTLNDLGLSDCGAKCDATAGCVAIQHRHDKLKCKLLRTGSAKVYAWSVHNNVTDNAQLLNSVAVC